MKIKPKQYAQILFDLVEGRKAGEIRGIINKFTQALVSNRDLGEIEKIIDEFIKLWNKRKKIVEAEIVSARDLNKDIVKLLNGYIVKITKAKEVVIDKKVDKNILGGVVVRHGDKVLDGSVRAKLDDLKTKMIK